MSNISVADESDNAENNSSSRQRHRKAIGVRGLVVILLLILSIAVAVRWWPNADSTSEGIDFRQRFKGGALIISGGGRLPPEIRQRFVFQHSVDVPCLINFAVGGKPHYLKCDLFLRRARIF